MIHLHISDNHVIFGFWYTHKDEKKQLWNRSYKGTKPYFSCSHINRLFYRIYIYIYTSVSLLYFLSSLFLQRRVHLPKTKVWIMAHIWWDNTPKNVTSRTLRIYISLSAFSNIYLLCFFKEESNLPNTKVRILGLMGQHS